MSAPLAYFLSWTTHGSWLPGDDRGWIDGKKPGVRAPDPDRHDEACRLMTRPPVRLTPEMRTIVEATIRDHCRIRGWTLHAVNARSNHVHIVVAASVPPEKAMEQFKAWCSRRLNEAVGNAAPRKWWTEHGSTKWVNDEGYLSAATNYVENCQ